MDPVRLWISLMSEADQLAGEPAGIGDLPKDIPVGVPVGDMLRASLVPASDGLTSAEARGPLVEPWLAPLDSLFAGPSHLSQPPISGWL
jgi:hypothetical protein